MQQLLVQEICKSFGSHTVLDQVSFKVEAGKAMGLLGRNGAGKTTTIRIIMQVFPPDRGQVQLDGKPLHIDTVSIGYLPEEKGLYPKFKIGGQLVYLGRLRGLSHREAVHSVRYWLERLSLEDYYDKKLETLSKGNQQKIQLALALLASPEIIILDEPFSGLDPVNAQLLKQIVREQVDIGKIVLFSSHQMSYVEQFCDEVALLNRGKIILQGNLREIKRSAARNRLLISLQAVSPEESLAAMQKMLQTRPLLLQRIEQFECVADGCLLHLSDEQDRLALMQMLSDNQVAVEQFRTAEPTLETIFVEKVGEDYEEAAV